MSLFRMAIPADLTAFEERRDPYLESKALAATEARLGRPVTVEEATVALRRTRAELAGARVGTGSSLPPPPVEAPRGRAYAERDLDWDVAGYYRPRVYRLDPPLHAVRDVLYGREEGHTVTHVVLTTVGCVDDPLATRVEIEPCHPDGGPIRGARVSELRAKSYADALTSIGYDAVERCLAPTVVERRGARKGAA